MPALDAIAASQLACLVGLPDAPSSLGVRTGEDFGADPRSLPGAMRRDWQTACSWATGYAGHPVTAVCHRGLKLSQGSAAWFRHAGTDTARPGLAPHDAFPRQARGAVAETHNRPAPVPAAEGRRVRETAP